MPHVPFHLTLASVFVLTLFAAPLPCAPGS